MVDLQWYNHRMLLRLHSQSTSLPGSKRSIYVWPFNVKHMSVLDWQRIVETRVTVEHKLETYLEYGRARLKRTSNTEKNRVAWVIFWPWSTVFEECFDRAQEMLRPYSRYVLTLLEVYLDHARGMCWLFSRFASTVLQVCFDRARGIFQPSVKIKFKHGRERSKHASNTVENCFVSKTFVSAILFRFIFFARCYFIVLIQSASLPGLRCSVYVSTFKVEHMLVLDRKRIAKTGLGSSTSWKRTAITVELVQNTPQTRSSRVKIYIEHRRARSKCTSSPVKTYLEHGEAQSKTYLKRSRAGSKYTSSAVEHGHNIPEARSRTVKTCLKYGRELSKKTSSTVELGRNIPQTPSTTFEAYLKHGRSLGKYTSSTVKKHIKYGRAWSKHTAFWSRRSEHKVGSSTRVATVW